jgi:hypothetical protein
MAQYWRKATAATMKEPQAGIEGEAKPAVG